MWLLKGLVAEVQLYAVVIKLSSCMHMKVGGAGIGGFRVGLQSVPGYIGRCVMASEINPWARAIYSLNFQVQTV